MSALPTDDKLQRRWRSTLKITACLLTIGLVMTFGVAFFARELNFSVFGWPFSFWVAAQGAPVVYLVLVCLYARSLSKLDIEYGVAEDD